jgi:hypothetical protein
MYAGSGIATTIEGNGAALLNEWKRGKRRDT